MNSEAGQSGEIRKVSFDGACTIERAAELKRALLDGLNSANRVELEMVRLTAVDISFFQLVCSAHKAAMGSMKHFALGTALPRLFVDAARSAGFYRTVGCHNDPRRECLWVEVGKHE